MIEKLKRKIALFWIKRAHYYLKKGGTKNIMKSLDCMKYSARFADQEERDYLAKSIRRVIDKHDNAKTGAE